MLKLLILALKSVLETDNTKLYLERRGDAAIARVKNDRPNVALIDFNLPGKIGLQVLLK